MKVTIPEVQEAIVAALGGVIPCYPDIPASPDLPFAAVGWPELIEFGTESLAGHSNVQFALVIYISTADIKTARKQMGEYMSSVRTAIEAAAGDPTWMTIHVDSMNNVRDEAVGQAKCLAFDLNITTIA